MGLEDLWDFDDEYEDELPWIPTKTKTKSKTTKKETIMAKDTLYEIDDDYMNTRFGTKLAVNSAGLWVMEIKGTGAVEAINPKNIKEVTPYTINVRFNANGQEYAYFNEGRQCKAGEFYIVDGYGAGAFQIAQVVAVDTKGKQATKEFKFYQKLS